ncbi:restriction endonuclease subunit S [Pseudomonas aeruginosa]|nr:restriction endonuclease subunit S [Pseudomonas aeruginosa]
MSELPSGWVSTTIGEINDYSSGNIDPLKAPAQVFELYSVPVYPTGKPEHLLGQDIGSTKQCVEPGDVLLCKINPRINRVWMVGPKSELPQIGSSEWVVIRQPLIHSGFLRYQLSESSFRDKLCSEVSGVGGSLTRAQPKKVATYPVVLPPFAEQTRIAAKLDELLAQVDTLKARIDGIPALLKRFRQSVLAAAVSGRLTEEWRAQNFGCVDEGGPITEPASSSLPVGWSSKTAGDICGFITKGTTPSKEKMTAGHGEVPYIKVYNLTFTGALDFSIDPTFVDSSTHSTDLKRSIVKPGDVLMNIVDPPLGKVSIVPATYPEWNINQAIARFRAGDEISAAYLALCLRTEEVLSHAVSRAKATAGQFNLTLEICRELPLPVPPAEEQTEIVRRVEQLFAFADQLEAKVASAKSRIDHLTQSILAKAFRGELVPQDPNDEPASVLLERIQAQRAAAPKAKRGRKASV